MGLHPSTRSLWVSVTLIWMMVAGSCNASRAAVDLLTSGDDQLPSGFYVGKVMGLAFALVLVVGAWAAWRWRSWGYATTLTALGGLLALNIWRAGNLGWKDDESNLFCLVFIALMVPVAVAFKQFSNYRAQMTRLSEEP